MANWHSFQALNRSFLFDVPSNSLSIYKPDHLGCELQRKRLECALALKGIALAAESEQL
jgi:hypothetical protein